MRARMCLMLLMCLSLQLAITSELLLVRCNACLISCLKRKKQGLAKGPLGNRPATHKCDRQTAEAPLCGWKSHGSAKGRG